MARGRENRKETTINTEYPLTEAQRNLGVLVNRVVYGGERIVLTKYGKAIAEIVPATAA